MVILVFSITRRRSRPKSIDCSRATDMRLMPPCSSEQQQLPGIRDRLVIHYNWDEY